MPQKRKKKAASKDLWTIEKGLMKKMRAISWNIESQDPTTMYEAAGGLMAHETPRSLLPRAMSLLGAQDASVRRLVFRMVARNVYGIYIPELFSALEALDPAEREQVLQNVEENFADSGGPISSSAQKKWIDSLEELGREHQPTVFGMMALLGKSGSRWVMKRIRDHVETISLGTVPKLLVFPEPSRSKMIQTLCQKAAVKKSELVIYISGIVDGTTVRYLSPFLSEGNWQDRVEVAKAVGRLGVTKSTGIIMDVIADPDWRVKQGLLENVNVAASKFSSLMRILGYLVTDTHTRVRGLAERTLLMTGIIPCIDTNVETQQKRVHRKFRKQLLRAAPVNKDIDSSWLGIDTSEMDPFPYFSEEDVAVEQEGEATSGVSLSDIEPVELPAPEEEAAETGKVDLLAALMSARDDSTSDDSTDPGPQTPVADMAIDDSLPPSDRVIQMIKKLTGDIGKDVPLAVLKVKMIMSGISDTEFDKILKQLERDGIVYRSSEDTVSYTDLKL
ncbi:MAG: hypothetical protein ACXAEN_02930 [Candidatus Thorarchaeota archaeon]|jgi:hypothetical protein